VPLATGAADGTPRQQRGANLLAPVCQVRCPHHLSSGVAHHGQPGRLTAGIDLDPQRLCLGIWYRLLKDNGERISPPDGGFPLGEQPPGIARMDRSQGTMLRI
jgi:hypothetical protein